MVLVDTSVWVHHFRHRSESLITLLSNDQVLCHPLILLEIACGSPPAPRLKTLASIAKLQIAKTATTFEIMDLIESNDLYDSGCGAIDTSLLASTLITQEAKIWTKDKKLEALAKKLGVCYKPSLH
ncbi:VapC Predicted nucleic acid-binding protein, contains PIN domain [Burkholderiaceae bacterium]|jgi:predicted nucleic acid-binding protein